MRRWVTQIAPLVLTWRLSLADKAVMAPNLDPFGRDRAAYQEHSRQRRIAEREARRCDAHFFLSLFCVSKMIGFFLHTYMTLEAPDACFLYFKSVTIFNGKST